MHKIITVTALSFVLIACSGSDALNVTRGLLGYIPPPEETTISEELRLEFERCKKIGTEKNCAQAAYDMVRTVKGLEPRTVPEGIVIILEGDGGHGDPEEEQKKSQNQN